MTPSSEIIRHYPNLNDAQKAIISHDKGPLLVIAGPGSGKTLSLVLRTMNIFLTNRALPKQVIVCTFTEKAAFELRDRISAAVAKLNCTADLSELRVTTIHGLCSRILATYRHKTDLGNNFETLDELTQRLFIFDHFEEIIGPETEKGFLGRWKTKWTAIEGVTEHFNKITEELVDPAQLSTSNDDFLRQVGQAYNAYTRQLVQNNRLDFAHLQKHTYNLLQKPEVGAAIAEGIKYVMVDEYQDTNYIQEQLLLKLTERNYNLCVVGDEDQSLYRFRGATVRNILEFSAHVPNCTTLKLVTNYRSHPTIIKAYDRWMASADWSNPKGKSFRYDKTIAPDPESDAPDYPAVFCLWGQNAADEADRFADMVTFLKKSEVISDYNQVALLLHSVRLEHSGRFLDALSVRGIPAFCPRARAYFENEEVRYMVACFAIILGYYGEGRGALSGVSLIELAAYVDACLVDLAKVRPANSPLARALQQFASEITALNGSQSVDMRPADYFYRFLAHEPFGSLMKNENRARNLAIFSQLLNVFQSYYHYTVITASKKEYIRFHLFNSFFRMLYEGGINEYEDPDQPFPKGHVQVMTIHQSKGLEFPVVVVGSLDVQLSTAKGVDRDLHPFYHRPPFEPEKRITLFDRMRLHYVAFSRAEKILVLTSSQPPKDHFKSIWQGLPQWPYVKKELLAAQRFSIKDRMPLKRSFSFTGDLKLYETCPRQYQFFREYDFTPSRSAVIFFGLLVHQTIEEIHRIAIDHKLDSLDDKKILQIFDRTFTFLSLADVHPVGDAAREAAFKQVINYAHQNRDAMLRIIETEVDVSVEKDGYILVGKVDLLMGSDGKLELLDFKTSPRPENSPELLSAYERQLCTYAHILERRYGKRPDRLLLYWTSEADRNKALMELPYRPELVTQAGKHFDRIVQKILAKDFAVAAPPEPKICKECDLRSFCAQTSVIRGQTRKAAI